MFFFLHGICFSKLFSSITLTVQDVFLNGKKFKALEEKKYISLWEKMFFCHLFHRETIFMTSYLLLWTAKLYQNGSIPKGKNLLQREQYSRMMRRGNRNISG